MLRAGTGRRTILSRGAGPLTASTLAADALLQSWSDNGVPANAARSALVRSLIRNLYASGVWQKMDIFCMLAAHNSLPALWNWITPQNNQYLIVSGTPTFTIDRGYTGNGVDGKLSSTFTPTFYITPSAHLACFALTGTATAASDLSIYTSGAAIRGAISCRNGATAKVVRVASATALASTGATDAPTMIAGDRNNDANNEDLYQNGVFNNTGAAGGAAVGSNGSFQLLMDNSAFSDRQIAFGCCGAALGASGQAALYDAVSTYLRAVGAI